MKLFKKNVPVCILAILMILSLTLAGCGSTPQESPKVNQQTAQENTKTNQPAVQDAAKANEKVSLDFWIRDTRPSNLKAMDEIIKNFVAKNPNITINVVQTPWSSAEQKVTTAIASNSLPDLSQLNQTGAADYGAKDILLNLDEKFKNFDTSNITGLSLKQAMYNGIHYAVPWFAGSNVMFYNKTLFVEAGIVDAKGEAKPPVTWDEFIKDAKLLTKANQWGFVERGTMDNVIPIREFMLAAGDGLMIDSDHGNKVVIDTPKNLVGLQFYLDLYQKYKVVPPDTLSIDGSAEEQAFLSGKVAMMFNGPWDLGTMYDSKIKWGVALEPKSEKNACHIGGCPVGIFKSTKHPDEAWKFATFLLEDESQRIWGIKNGCGLPGTKSIQEEAKADPVIKVFVEGLQAAEKDGVTPPPQDPHWASIERTIAPPHFQKALLKEVTPEQCLKDLQAEAEAALKQ